jgi:hypothetical protein
MIFFPTNMEAVRPTLAGVGCEVSQGPRASSLEKAPYDASKEEVLDKPTGLGVTQQREYRRVHLSHKLGEWDNAGDLLQLLRLEVYCGQ